MQLLPITNWLWLVWDAIESIAGVDLEEVGPKKVKKTGTELASKLPEFVLFIRIRTL